MDNPNAHQHEETTERVTGPVSGMTKSAGKRSPLATTANPIEHLEDF